MTRIYVPYILTVGNQYELTPENVRHLNVLRIRSNEHIIMFNGDGNDYDAELIQITKRNAIVLIKNKNNVDNECKIDLTLAICIVSNDKMDLIIQKATELGVTQIIPIISDRSQKIATERISNRLEHWKKIIISSCEQSGRNKLPIIDTPQKYENHILSSKNHDSQLSIIFSPHNDKNCDIMQHTKCQRFNRASLLIGSEGGFTAKELEMAINNGFKCIKLGKRILRAETAAIVAVTFVQTIWGEFNIYN